MNDFLHQAYMETIYTISDKGKTFTLKINIPNLEFNSWCMAKKIDSWAIITAFNPYSQEFTKGENEELNDQLKKMIVKKNFSFNEAKGIPNTINWEEEDSFFIHNISLEEAQEIGSFFRQNAIVYGLNGGSKNIIWLV
ncbi:DUF3293 domain-containing protein [Aquimarina sediminis]|uniref:DUF3293 domain-containing protein n=1 Tax=Aquimarina sediminis TaxID=2070536 RepID=UPI000CA05FFC|nr:DUF3293 domain-containing protein [Aquimarina sediminis]